MDASQLHAGTGILLHVDPSDAVRGETLDCWDLFVYVCAYISLFV